MKSNFLNKNPPSIVHWLTIAQIWGFVKLMIHAFTVKSQLHNRFQESSSFINDQWHSAQVPRLISETVVFLDSNLDWNDCQDSGFSLFWNLGPEGRGSITVNLLRSVCVSIVQGGLMGVLESSLNKNISNWLHSWVQAGNLLNFEWESIHLKVMPNAHVLT